ncbi:MAG: hypothetical protein KDC43_14760 [Saprospiraceae bacterium]|nr:hypothetical protein [Saprospiraceae bacterium]MCB0679094.1 hypothetical protein [Saprospiraceae bacterium]
MIWQPYSPALATTIEHSAIRKKRSATPDLFLAPLQEDPRFAEIEILVGPVPEFDYQG